MLKYSENSILWVETIMKKTYFIADLHLSENRPQLTRLFVDFMQNQAPQGEALYILGDLFDFWIGDDETSPLIDLVQEQIRRLSEWQIPCYFIHGNRDFLLGNAFAQRCGLQLLPDYQRIDLYGTSTLICHGDTLCTDDVKYQQFRKKVRQKWRQRLFLWLPLKVRLQTMEQFNVTRLIHGHTHRQHIHQIPPHFERIVLGDWGETASVLAVTETGYEFV